MLVNGAPVGAVAILLALFSSVGGFIFGYDTGQISDFLEMDDFLTRFASCTDRSDASTCHFTNVRTGLIVSMLSIGTMVGALTGATIADRMGRRRAITIYCLWVCLGTVIQAASIHSWEQLMVGRIITGLGVGALSAVVPLYQSETAPKEIRGSLVATYQLFITFGILIAYCISIGTRDIGGSSKSGSWRIVLCLNILWALILGIGILFAPESPRWLMAKGLEVECELALARIRGVRVEDNDLYVKQTLVEIEAAVRAEEQMDKFRWIECFYPGEKILYRTLLLMVLQSFQQLTGASFFFYYGATVFKSVGLSDSFVTQIILGAVNFFGGVVIVERFGRRIPLIVGGVWQSIWLFVFAAAGTAKDPVGNQGIGNLMIVSACLFIAGYAMTWAPCIWILVGETFPTRSRAKQGALATTANWLWVGCAVSHHETSSDSITPQNFLIGFFTSFITGDIHYRYGFIFAACNLAGAVIVYLFLYESSALSLEMVDMMYNDPKVKPWNSAKWVPPGHQSRADFNQAIEAERKQNLLKDVKHRELADGPEDSAAAQHPTAIQEKHAAAAADA